MPISEHARQRRKDYIGSSDAAAILGRDPYKTINEVYWSKVSDLHDDAPTEAMMTGNRLEGALLDFAEERIGKPIRRNQFRVADNGIQASNLDAIVCDANEAVEAKVTSVVDEWGDDGTDEVSQYALLQCQHHMAVTGFDAIWVPCLCVRFHAEWRLYKVPRNQDIIDILTAEELRFWRENVLTETPPNDEPPPMRMLSRMLRDPESVTKLDEETSGLALAAWHDYKTAGDAKSDAEKQYENARAACLRYLGDAEAAELVGGAQLRYVPENAGDRCDSKTLRIEEPEIYEKYFHLTTRRVLRLKNAPKGRQ